MTNPEQPEQIDRENSMTKASETLVERLRLIAAWRKPGGPTPTERKPSTYKTCNEAADELTQLSAENEQLREVVATARASVDFILGCLQAAEAEGISQRIRELEPDPDDPASISGIFARRINWAYGKAQELSADLNGGRHD